MPTQEELREYFDYDPQGYLLFKKTNRKGRIGTRAGWKNQAHPYRLIYWKQRFIQTHRLVWIWHHGEIPAGLVIDHIDRDTLNNRIENLRLVTRLGNARNAGLDKRNTSGYPGIKYKHHKWYAAITANYEVHHLGTFAHLEDAIAARKQAEVTYWQETSNGKMVPSCEKN